MIPKGDKKNLPRKLVLSDIPEDSQLHEDNKRIELKYAKSNARKQSSEESRKELRSDDESSETEAVPQRRVSPEELLLLGIKELQDRGLEIGRDYHITENGGITVGRVVRLRQRGGTSTSSAPKDKWQEIGWMPESVRRERAKKMTKEFTSNIKTVR